jgi:hypothetical protein
MQAAIASAEACGFLRDTQWLQFTPEHEENSMSRLNQRVTRRLGAVVVVAMALVWTFALIANDKQQAGAAGDSGKSATKSKNDTADNPPVGGFGGPGSNGGVRDTKVPFASNNSVWSGSVYVACSKSGKTLWGYSAHTGTWDKVRLEPAVKGFNPVVEGEIACIVVGKRAYAFSSTRGRWDSVELAEWKEPPVPILERNEACVVAGSHVYGFSAKVGRWDVINIGDSKQPPVPVLSDTDRISVEAGSKIYMFSANSGRWSMADLSVDAD